MHPVLQIEEMSRLSKQHRNQVHERKFQKGYISVFFVLYFGSFCKNEPLLCFYISYWKIPLILFLFHLLSGSLRFGKLVLQMLHTAPESCFQLLKHETPSNFAQVFSSCTFPPTICIHFSTLSCISSFVLSLSQLSSPSSSSNEHPDQVSSHHH